MIEEAEDSEQDELDEEQAALGGLHALEVAETDAGLRLDRFVTDKLGLSRSRVQTLIRNGRVAGPQGPLKDPGSKVRSGERLRIDVPAPEPAIPLPQRRPLAIAYEDKHLIVIDKPAGLVVHPAAGHAEGTLVNALLAHCGDELSGIGGVKRPGIVHRLDKDTSGLLVVAKTDAAHQGLAEQFASHGVDGRLTRTYEALVWGIPKHKSGTITANIGRSRTNRKRMAVMRGQEGRHAVTHYEVEDAFFDAEGKPLASRLALQLETGRTHQIRVHLAHLGHPVMGDPAYGTGFKTSSSRLSEGAAAALQALGRQALHARTLGFEHPITKKRLSFTSPRPADIAALNDALLPKDSTSRKMPKANVSKR